MKITAGSKGADYANPNVKVDVLKTMGVKFVGRYIDGTASTRKPSWKVVTKAERKSLGVAGIGLVLVFEVAADNPLKGAAQGKIDGAYAVKDAFFLAYDPSVPIVVAIDTDVHSGNVAAVEAYVRAFAKACAPYKIGIYGDYDIIERCKDISQLNWQANAWGWSAVRWLGKVLKRNHPLAHVYQNAQKATAAGLIDPAVAVRDFDAWLPPKR